MKVEDVMTTEVVTADRHTTFHDLVEMMLAHRISALPIVDDDHRLVGIVTEADLLGKEAYAGARQHGVAGYIRDLWAGRETWLQKADALDAEDLMTEPVVTAEPDELARAAARRMLEEGVKRLPVVARGMVVGIVSRADLLKMYRRDDRELHASVDHLVRRCMFVPPDHHVTIDIHDGIVTLRGDVMYESDVRVLDAIITAADGVVAVQNLLRFREKDPVPA